MVKNTLKMTFTSILNTFNDFLYFLPPSPVDKVHAPPPSPKVKPWFRHCNYPTLYKISQKSPHRVPHMQWRFQDLPLGGGGVDFVNGGGVGVENHWKWIASEASEEKIEKK